MPQTVDRANPVERFLLLTPGGPVVVEATITIDGQSFHEPREKLVDEMLKLATDKDGKLTWTQAIANSRKFVGQVQSFANEDQRKQYLDAMDVNHDGLVDRYEARRMLAQRAGGGDFLLNGGDSYAMFEHQQVLVAPSDGHLMVSALEEYISSRGTVAPLVEGRIRNAR